MRPARIVLSAAALRHNMQQLKRLAGNAHIWAVIKANAYGHGLTFAAHTLAPLADGFAVATLEEAEQLRQEGVTHPVLLLEGLFDAEEAARAQQLSLSLVIHQPQQIDWLAKEAPEHAWTLWLKLDTGMHRLGFDWKEIDKVIQQIKTQLPNACINFLSHLSCAEDTDDRFTETQLNRFKTATSGFTGQKSLANSAALIRYPETRFDWVRPGIALYGATPLLSDLEPVMRFESRLIALHWIEKGEGVGYGLRWQATRRSLIGVVAAGYGDGYPRHTPDGTSVWVDGARVPLAGRVSMDMITVDLTDHPRRDQLAPGAPVELWGRHIAITEVARYAKTIPYTLLCGITERVHRYEES